MSKAADLARVSVNSSFHYMWGLIVSTVISSVGAIFIARLLGSDLYGLYGIVVTIPTLIGIFRDWGVNTAMIRFAAQRRAEGKEEEIRSIFISGLILEVTMGLALSIISFGVSFSLADTIYNRPHIAPLIQIASFTILAQGIGNAATAVFMGVERMEHNSIMLICQSSVKTAVVIALVIGGFSISGAVIGYTIAMTVSALVGALLVWILYKKLPKPSIRNFKVKTTIKLLLTFGTPLSLATIISSFQAQFCAFLLPIHYLSDNVIIGNYYIATTFVVLITFFATPITSVLFPAFSKLNPNDDKETLRNVYQFSIKYASVLVVPVAALVMSLAEPAISTLFGDTYGTAPLVLALLSISYLYTAFGTLTNGNFIVSQGETKLSFYLTALTATIGLPMGYALIMSWGVLGLVATTLIARLPSMFISIAWIRKHYAMIADWRSSAQILFSSAVAAIPTYFLASLLGYSNWIRLILGMAFFICVFGATALLTRTITRSDIINLRAMTGGLGRLSTLVNKLLDLTEKMMGLLRL